MTENKVTEDPDNGKLPTISPQILFEMTGTFNQTKAIGKYRKSAATFVAALAAVGGEIPEVGQFLSLWGPSVGLPAKGVGVLIDVMIRIGWLTRVKKEDGINYLLLAPKGRLKASFYKEKRGDEAAAAEE